MPRPVSTIEDYKRFVDQNTPTSAIGVVPQPQEDFIDWQTRQTLNRFEPRRLGCRAFHIWNSLAGVISTFQTDNNDRIVRISDISSAYFAENYDMGSGELGAFEDFIRNVRENPNAHHTINLGTPAEVNDDSLVTCVTTLTPEYGNGPIDTLIRSFYLAPPIAARALWLTGAFLPQRINQ